MTEKMKYPKKASRILFAAVIVAVFLLVLGSFYIGKAVVYQLQSHNSGIEVGTEIDALHGVAVYFNGSTGHVAGRNTSADGYNIGQKWQCVEFVKRYYYEHFNHKMPDPWGHAKDFFNPKVADGTLNPARGLIQFSNGGGNGSNGENGSSDGGNSCPQVSDLVVYDGHIGNRYGHVAIVAYVTPIQANSEASQPTSPRNNKPAYIEIIQQNPGPSSPSREQFLYTLEKGKCTVDNSRILGWLRLPS